jgi:hypothetical protein
MELSAGHSVNTIPDIVMKFGWKTVRLERGGGRKYSKQQVGNKENMQFGECPLSFGPERICRLAVCYAKTRTLKYTELHFDFVLPCIIV